MGFLVQDVDSISKRSGMCTGLGVWDLGLPFHQINLVDMITITPSGFH